MPEIDNDLFNFLVVAFLAILVIASIVALSLLGGIKKALDALARRDGEPGAAPSTTAPAVAAASTPLGGPEDARAADHAAPAEDRRDAEEAARAERERDEAERAAREAEEARRAQEERERARLEAEREAEEARRRAEQESAAASSATAADEPQEQPFERDGRWWFRRGDELLVYDERRQEWVSAASEGTAPDTAEGQPGAATEELAATPSETGGSFWKCPNCGAVNGSTATTCRMCFSARP